MATDQVRTEDLDYSAILWREDGVWNSIPVPAQHAIVLDDLLALCKQYPGEGGVYAAVGVGEEFFILLRNDNQKTEVVISDGAALLDWDIAEDAADLIELDWQEGDFEEFEAVGDLNLFSNFGLKSQDLSMICENPDLEPDQQISEIFKRIGAEFAWQKIHNQ
ncbi:MAG: tRNA adenosine deaminase-associated protein [Candidatus Nanopelagicales bacterium]|nr:tRNA adenosine deaminase-associated protein [Candidatus Nanopelagicales bacterium]